jgi:hypothetical protein
MVLFNCRNFGSVQEGSVLVQEKLFRRNNQRWSSRELDRLLRAVKLEDVTPPVDRFVAIAETLERTPASVRGMWLELRDAGLRGRRAASPVVAAYAQRRFPGTAARPDGDETLDGLIAQYRAAQQTAEALLQRIFVLAAQDAEALAGLRQTLFGYAATQAAPDPVESEVAEAYESEGVPLERQPAA